VLRFSLSQVGADRSIEYDLNFVKRVLTIVLLSLINVEKKRLREEIQKEMTIIGVYCRIKERGGTAPAWHYIKMRKNG